MTQGATTRRTGTILGALGAAACLFLLLESAIARHVGADLLLPVSNGTFLPGRLARMGALLVLCLAAALTGRGRLLQTRLRDALQKDRYCWLAAAVVTGLFFAWALRVTVMSFMTNDDKAILRAIGRIANNGPAGITTFSRPMFCAMLAQLYRLAPGGYWYAWYHLAIVLLCCTVTGRCIHLKLRRRMWPVWIGFFIHGLLCAGLFLYPIAEMSFTVTPALAGSAAVALILCRDDTSGRIGPWITDVCSILLMVLCCLQRKSTGKCLQCFWALAMGYQFLRPLAYRRPKWWKSMLRTAVCAAVTVAVISSAVAVTYPAPPAEDEPAQTEQSAGGYSRSTAEYYRSQVMDYLLNNLTDEQLEKAGLPPELSALLRTWYFMDERINTDTFINIVTMYGNNGAKAESSPEDETASGTPSLRDMLASATKGEEQQHTDYMAYAFAGLTVLLVLVLLRLLRGFAGWLETLCGLCAAGGAGILFLYLIQGNRFPLRVFLIVAIPAAVTMLLMVLDVPPSAAGGSPVRRRITVWLTGLSVLGLCICCASMVRAVPYTSSPLTSWDVFEDQRATESYANAHPDIHFITNFLSQQDLDPFHSPWGYPSNMSRWGGTGFTASTNRHYADYFFEDDVRLMYYQPSTLIAMLQYLSLDFGPVQAVCTDKLTKTIWVADFSQTSPGEDYTGWYECNGMTYYFQDGQALTGEQTINGKTYTFAPAGAASRLVVAHSPEGLIYCTDAYSLIEPAE